MGARLRKGGQDLQGEGDDRGLRGAGRPAGAPRSRRKGRRGAGRRRAVAQGGHFKPKEGNAAAPRARGVRVAIAGPPWGRRRGSSREHSRGGLSPLPPPRRCGRALICRWTGAGPRWVPAPRPFSLPGARTGGTQKPFTSTRAAPRVTPTQHPRPFGGFLGPGSRRPSQPGLGKVRGERAARRPGETVSHPPSESTAADGVHDRAALTEHLLKPEFGKFPQFHD